MIRFRRARGRQISWRSSVQRLAAQKDVIVTVADLVQSVSFSLEWDMTTFTDMADRISLEGHFALRSQRSHQGLQLMRKMSPGCIPHRMAK